jgi:hypothetical protein
MEDYFLLAGGHVIPRASREWAVDINLSKCECQNGAKKCKKCKNF